MSNYQEYIPNFLPRLRDQARRFSESSPSLSPFPLPPFPQVPDFSAWAARFWNSTTPPPSIDEGEEAVGSETTVQALARTIQLWTQQLNSDPFSPPLEPTLDPTQTGPHHVQDVATTQFPELETEVPPARPLTLENVRTNSDTSVNPARRLHNRSRMFSDHNRGHSQSDPLAAVQFTQTSQVQHGPSDVDVYVEDGHQRRRDGSDTLPEDDGMGPLRQRINAIWTGPGTPLEKSKLIHILMNERHKAAMKAGQIKPRSRTGSIDQMQSSLTMTLQPSFRLSGKDLTPTYAPLNEEEIEEGITERPLGCVHYRRNVKVQCVTCNRWYNCRLCHDEAEDHVLPRRETKFMLCMLCKTPQGVSQTCTSCGEQAARYYCPICKLWNNDPRKSIYHCDDCGLCRLGEGLGKDYFHCKTCAACMSIEAQATHRCIEHSTKCDCPICGEYLFTSHAPVAFMRCGHSIHKSCYKDLCDTSYKCPICSKSITNMESEFRRLDRTIEEQPMPPEYRDKRAYVFCNDCLCRCVTTFHWLGTKCIFCFGYNTVQLEMVGEAPSVQLQIQEAAQERANDAGMGERSMTASQTHTPIEDISQPAYPEQLPQTNLPSQHQPAVNTTVATSPTVQSPWLMPHSPSSRSVRSVSPVVGSYFGTGGTGNQSQRSSTPIAAMSAAAGMAAAAGAEFARRISSVGRATPVEGDEDMDFWGGQSPRSNEGVLLEQDADPSGEDADDDSDDSDDDVDMDGDLNEGDDDDDADEDIMDVFGHR